MMLLYNILFPVAFLAFIPGMIYKLIRRPGHKKTFLERFAIFSAEQKQRLTAARGSTWIHAVSVGETMIAVAMIKAWRERDPSRKIVLSTTTTTGQELARTKAPDDVPVFYCPIDFIFFVKKVVAMIQPAMLVIFETELWPNMIREVRKRGSDVILVNGRISDKSYRGYSKFTFFFGPILANFTHICVQSEMDGKRFAGLTDQVPIHVSGNLKFDQAVPKNLPEIELKDYFGDGEFFVILGASTHPGEERLIGETFLELKQEHPELRLVLVPRHAERGSDICNDLKSIGLSYHRKTAAARPDAPVDCLLADTTGEMLGFIKSADIVIMGKSLAGHDEGHNLIEPALLAKPIVTGSVLRNFRFVFQVLTDADAVRTVRDDSDLSGTLEALINDRDLCTSLGEKAKAAIEQHRGATNRVIDLLEKTLNS